MSASITGCSIDSKIGPIFLSDRPHRVDKYPRLLGFNDAVIDLL